MNIFPRRKDRSHVEKLVSSKRDCKFISGFLNDSDKCLEIPFNYIWKQS
eukprot:UN12932